MTRRIVLILLAVAPVAVAQPVAKTAPKTPWANKLFVADILKNPGQESPAAVTHDFGTVPAGTVSAHTFTFTNIYDVPLQVVDVRLECGCLKAFPPNKVLQPNEQGEFTVTMNAAQFKGAVTKKMLVTVGPSYVSTAELRFSAVSRDDVSLTAPGMIDFGLVPQGKSAAKEVTLKYTGAMKDWKAELAKGPAGPYTVDVTETARGFLSTDYKITVGLKDTAAAGPLADTVTLKTNDPNTPTVTVAIGGSVQPPVKVAGEGVVVFEGVKAGEVKVGQVMITANANCKLTAAADDLGDGMSLDIFPHSHQVHIVKVRYEPAKAAAPFRKEVRVKTDLPGQPEVVFVVEVR
jgi:hypothetical protein